MNKTCGASPWWGKAPATSSAVRSARLPSSWSPFGFARTHKSYVVNLLHVENLFRDVLTLVNGSQVPCSRMHHQEVTRRIRERQPSTELWAPLRA